MTYEATHFEIDWYDETEQGWRKAHIWPPFATREEADQFRREAPRLASRTTRIVEVRRRECT